MTDMWARVAFLVCCVGVSARTVDDVAVEMDVSGSHTDSTILARLNASQFLQEMSSVNALPNRIRPLAAETAAASDPSTPDPFMPPALIYSPLYPSPDGQNVMVKMFIGTPEQVVYVNFDTGSGELYLFSRTTCTLNTQNIGKFAPTPCFDATISSTSSPLVNAPSAPSVSLFADGDTLTEVSPRKVTETESISLEVVNFGQTVASLSDPITAQFLYSRDIVRIETPGVIGSALHSYNSTAGVLGASYSTLASSVSSTFLNILQTFPFDVTDFAAGTLRFVFALDINRPQAAVAGVSGALHIGGITEQYRNRITWSEVAASPAFHEFVLYDLQLCGVSLFADSSSVRSAIVDTGASCLTLPAEFFDMVLAWIPVECEFLNTVTNTPACFLPKTVVPALPDLTFRISARGPLLRLPLNDLLLEPNSQGRRRLCLYRGASITSNEPAFFKKIVFGTRTLFSLYTVFNMKTGQVGMASKSVGAVSSFQCKVARQCVGMQTRYAPRNTCQDPPCKDYYFFELDEATHTCVLSRSIHAAAVIAICGFIALEMLFNEWHVQLSNKAAATIRSS